MRIYRNLLFLLLIVSFCIGASFLDSTKVVEGLKGQIGRAGTFITLSLQNDQSPTDGQNLTWNTGNIVTWEDDAGAGGGAPDQFLWDTIVGDTGSEAATSTTSILTFIGGTNCDTTVGTDTVTIDVTGGAGDVTAAANLGDNLLIRGDGAVKGVQNSGITISDTDNITGLGTLNTNTLPTGPDTLVGRATTDTLTNKTINTASNTITVVEADVSDLSHTPATADISDVSVTQTEFAEIETIGATTISANQWGAVGSMAETLTGTELSLLDGITVLSGSNTGDQTINTADIADVSVTQTELAELETIGATTLSAAQWAGLGGATTAGIALWDDANNVAQLVTLGLTATSSEINTPLDGASVTLTEFQELETIGATTISAAQWAALGGATAAGIALWDDAAASNQLVTLGLTATASEINTPLDGASVTLTEFQELETIGATTISANQWAMLGGVAETLGSAELDILDGALLDVTELNYVNGVTSAIQTQLDGKEASLTNKASLESTISDVADFAEADGDIFTGTHDFGGADDLEIPNSATPTVDTAGQIAMDTTITDHDGLLLYFQGAEAMVIPAIPLADLTTTDGHIIDYNAAGNKFTMDVPVAGGAAPTDATYITQTPDGTLSAEQALSALSTGIMRVATTTGVVTSLTDSAGIAANISDETGSGLLAFATSPTLTTPLLGTPTSGNLTNCTAYEGTAVLSTGEGGGTKFLREDGDNTCSWQDVVAAHAGTITWTGTSILESGVAFQFGDGTDATLTHTYGNTGTDVSIAYSTAAMAVTGALTATNLSGTNTGDSHTIASHSDTTATGAETETLTDGSNADSLHVHASAGLSGIVNADLSGTAGITLANTAITAGRSLTIATNDILADVELYTDVKTAHVADPVAETIATVWVAPIACTITKIHCESDQTVTFDLQIDDGTPADVNGTDIVCTTFATDASLAGDTTMAAGDRMDILIASVSGTPTWFSVSWELTFDD